MGGESRSVESIRALMIRLRDLICNAYEEQQFKELMYVHMSNFDYAGLPRSVSYSTRVFDTLVWAHGYGDAPHVLRLAQLVSDKRPMREDLKALVLALNGEIAPQPAQGANAADGGFLTDIETWLALYESASPELVRNLRPKLRTADVRPLDLPGRFHLSASEGRRLLAVLALEAAPDINYLRWLSERVAVEKPFTGFIAAQALGATALRSSADKIVNIRPALNEAAEALDGLVDSDDGALPGFDIAARKRQLQLALSLLDVRSRRSGMLPPAEINGFLAAFVAVFDAGGVDQLCRNRLQTDLKFFAKPNDPIELIVVNLVVTARDNAWLPDLIRAAYAERSDNETFARIHNLLGPALGAVA